MVLAAIEASGALGGEGGQLAKDVVTIAEKNGFDMIAGTILADWFAETEFDYWNTDGAGASIKTAIRKVIRSAKQQEKLRSAPAQEEGEVLNKIDCPNDGSDALQRLSELFSRKPKTKIVHVETTKVLQEECGNWGKAPYSVLPNNDQTNEMAKELEAVVQKTKSTPFVHCSVEKFVPEWHDMQNHKEGFLLQPAVLMPALMRWAMAAQVITLLPFSRFSPKHLHV